MPPSGLGRFIPGKQAPCIFRTLIFLSLRACPDIMGKIKKTLLPLLRLGIPISWWSIRSLAAIPIELFQLPSILFLSYFFNSFHLKFNKGRHVVRYTILKTDAVRSFKMLNFYKTVRPHINGCTVLHCP